VARSALFAIDEIPLERVDRVELERTGGFRMVFERAGDGWIQREPFEHPADPASIREVIDVTASLGSSRAVDPAAIDPEARAALGLEPPVARITLTWPGGSRSVALGKRTVAGRAWARVDGRAEAVSVDAALHALAVDGDPRQWRDTGLWEQGSADIGRIEIRYGTAAGQRVVLARAAGKDVLKRVVEDMAEREDACHIRRGNDDRVGGLGRGGVCGEETILNPPGIPFIFDSLRFVGFMQFRHDARHCARIRASFNRLLGNPRWVLKKSVSLCGARLIAFDNLNRVTHLAVGGGSLAIHLRCERVVGFHIVVDSHRLLLFGKSVKSSGILNQSAFEGDRHGKEKCVEFRHIKPLAE
jgi:hypothetical protein